MNESQLPSPASAGRHRQTKAEAKLQVAPCALPLLARQDGEIMWPLSLVRVVPIDAALCIMDGCVIKLLA